MTLLLELLPDVLEHIACYLDAPDVLSFLSTHAALQTALGGRPEFWMALIRREGGTAAATTTAAIAAAGGGGGDDDDAATSKRRFLNLAYKQKLPIVKWHPIPRNHSIPEAREGHVACLLKDPNRGPDSQQLAIITGGYSTDERIYVKDMTPGGVAHSNNTWLPLAPASPPPDQPEFAYGASLTALNGRTAVRFGGFRAGGYSDETLQAVRLVVEPTSAPSTVGGPPYHARWNVQQPGTQSGAPLVESHLARAYHTATLLFGRYILILGGMQSNRSILHPALLDCEAWTWLDETQVAAEAMREDDYHDSDDEEEEEDEPTDQEGERQKTPSARFGHSVVWDEHRSRVVMFGGGSGSDLLRSGRDNSEVWQLAPAPDRPLPENASPRDFLASLPWKWTLLHADQNDDESNEDEDDDMNHVSNQETTSNSNRLRPAETLNLGRCHASHLVARDTALLLFGSGRPSSNGLLAYNLANDCFFRPRVGGALPIPRFTFTSVCIPDRSLLFVHGGYTSQRSTTVDDMMLLDLTPALRNDAVRGGPYPFAVSTRTGDRGALRINITDEEVLEIRNRPRYSVWDQMNMLLAGAPAELQEEHAAMLVRYMQGG